ncbi:MAG: aldo/keto reductase [Sedimentisphaerales bacterium]|nr:aldo/keto reductase [Sedimentisphaerales bacterium]
MKKDGLSRRDFMKTTSAAAAGTLAGTLAGRAEAADQPKSKIVNYNEKMHYRRLGKSNLMISEVSLGGHWKNRNAGRYWDSFASEEVPADVAKNRTEVVSACIDSGINYLDITTAAECLSYGVALKGRREKMIVGADIHNLGPRNSDFCNVKDQTRNVDTCLKYLRTDYLDIWRPQTKMDGSNTDAEVESLVETFKVLHKAGKVRHLGMSSHRRPWIEHILEKYPEFEMVIFPCSAKTREKGKPPVGENVEEVNPGHGSDQTQSIFKTVLERNVGVVTIKPFFGGSLFASCGKVSFPVMGVGSKTENDMARLTLQCILANKAITAAVPGLSTPYEVENAARASYVRLLGQSAAETQWLMKITDRQWANLPQDYQWLRDWEVV